MSFLIEGRAKNNKDIIRSWAWEFTIPNIGAVTDNVIDEEALTIRCRSVNLPARNIATITSNFMGTSQIFAGKSDFEKSFSITCEETSDLVIYKAFKNWQNMIFNWDLTSPLGGVSQKPIKRELTRDTYLKLYNYDGTEIIQFRYYNAFPTSVGDLPLSYDGDESVKFTVTFGMDFHQVA